MVTVSKSPSQMSGAWLSGSLGGRGGAGGLGGAGGGGGGGGTSFLTGGVTGSGSGWESVGLEEGMTGVEVGLVVVSGMAAGFRLSVGLGGSVGESVEEEAVGSSSEEEGEEGETLPGSLSGVGGEVGASLMRGGPWKIRDGKHGFRMGNEKNSPARLCGIRH